jgi:hypothetical protein
MARALPCGRLTLGALLALAACKGAPGPREASARTSERAAPVAWTTTFPDESVLAARVIEVVGPSGLLAHLPIVHDPANHLHEEKATREGMRIEEQQRPDSDGSPIRANLDNLVLIADERLTVLESPGASQVVVQASGDVYFHVPKTGEERRSESLRLVREQ